MAVLYINEQGAVVAKTGERIIVRKGDEVIQDIPAFKIKQVVMLGNAHITTPAIHFFLAKGIDVAYLSKRGSYRGRLQTSFSGNALLRQKQHACASDRAFCLLLAKRIVTSKIQSLLTFCQRQRSWDNELRQMASPVQKILRQVEKAERLEALYGLEGAASATYFKIFRRFLKVDWGFSVRVAHPPTDPINALLSLGYTLLYNNVHAAINVVGLDPYRGFFHQIKYGHACLASDLMEEFRPIIVDSVVLLGVNRGIIKRDDFAERGKGIMLSKEGLRKFLRLYEGRVQEKIVHPALGIEISYIGCFDFQARHLAKVLLGQEGGYMPLALVKNTGGSS